MAAEQELGALQDRLQSSQVLVTLCWLLDFRGVEWAAGGYHSTVVVWDVMWHLRTFVLVGM